MTDSTSHPDAFVTVIVGVAESPPVTNDRVLPANRAPPREEVQWDHPGSMLSFASGSAIKRITAGVKARRLTVPLLKFRSTGRAFTLRQSQFRTKEEYCFAQASASPHLRTLAGIKRLRGRSVPIEAVPSSVRYAYSTEQVDAHLSSENDF
jgi:hypothetical protein